MSIRGYDSWLLSGSGGPDDVPLDPSMLSVSVLILLEDYGVPKAITDSVMELIDDWDKRRMGESADKR